MLSDPEQQVWNDVERFWAEDAEEPRVAGRSADTPREPTPPKPSRRELDDAPLLLIGGFWAAVFLVLFGAAAAGLTLATATALGLSLWRYWPLLRDRTPSRPSTAGQAGRRPADGH